MGFRTVLIGWFLRGFNMVGFLGLLHEAGQAVSPHER